MGGWHGIFINETPVRTHKLRRTGAPGTGGGGPLSGVGAGTRSHKSGRTHARARTQAVGQRRLNCVCVCQLATDTGTAWPAPLDAHVRAPRRLTIINKHI